jgi:hypothetical protein
MKSTLLISFVLLLGTRALSSAADDARTSPLIHVAPDMPVHVVYAFTEGAFLKFNFDLAAPIENVRMQNGQLNPTLFNVSRPYCTLSSRQPIVKGAVYSHVNDLEFNRTNVGLNVESVDTITAEINRSNEVRIFAYGSNESRDDLEGMMSMKMPDQLIDDSSDLSKFHQIDMTCFNLNPCTTIGDLNQATAGMFEIFGYSHSDRVFLSKDDTSAAARKCTQTYRLQQQKLIRLKTKLRRQMLEFEADLAKRGNQPTVGDINKMLEILKLSLKKEAMIAGESEKEANAFAELFDGFKVFNASSPEEMLAKLKAWSNHVGSID